jgi:protein gp37
VGDKSGIEWTDATWNPTTGCDKVSPGCDHCYAMTLAPRLKAMEIANGRAETGRYQTDGDPATSGPGFGFAMHSDALDQPIRWTRPRVIFVNSMSDLFHSDMTLDFLAKVWAVMSVTPQHTYQVLTKRPQIARSIFTRNVAYGPSSVPFKFVVNYHRMQMGYPVLPDSAREDGTYAWPLPNVWLGTSVEDQKRADLRIGPLLETPAAHRFLSMEPLLGPVDLSPWLWEGVQHRTDYGTGVEHDIAPRQDLEWVIVGGESGKGARPMHPGWVRALRDQCAEADVMFMHKQWGNWAPLGSAEVPTYRDVWVFGEGMPTVDTREGEMAGRYWAKWAPDTAGSPPGRRDPYGDVLMRHYGNKKDAGRMLDGRTYDDVPGRTDREETPA